ncbi:MAG TPA: type II toxin-antitoxin system RelE/ParE family toxin [Ignavibacteria bacterium]|nr:type II toxin-antitoxin system RelE/ParE family toxin [Ignavibacteria bacterium]
MKIIWTELAVEKLEEFADYIALDKPSAALKWVRKIQKSVNKLKDFTEAGRKVPEIKRRDIREIIEGNYRLIYRIELGRISILTIRHCSQLLNTNDVLKK